MRPEGLLVAAEQTRRGTDIIEGLPLWLELGTYFGDS